MEYPEEPEKLEKKEVSDDQPKVASQVKEITGNHSTLISETSTPQIKTVLKVAGVFFLKCLASLVLIALFIPLVMIEAGVRLFSKNQRSLLTYLFLPATYTKKLDMPTVERLNEKLRAYNIHQTPDGCLAERMEQITLNSGSSTPIEAFHVATSSQARPRHLAIVFMANSQNARNVEVQLNSFLINKNTDPRVTDYLFVNYRGVGGSLGACVSLKDLVEDGEAAFQWAKGQTQTDSSQPAFDRLSLQGHSIGGGVAAALAQKHPSADVLLIHTFKNYTKATEFVLSKTFVRSVARFLAAISTFFGTQALAPHKHLLGRAQDLTAKGQLGIRQAMHDTILGPSALDNQAAYQAQDYWPDNADHLFT